MIFNCQTWEVKELKQVSQSTLYPLLHETGGQGVLGHSSCNSGTPGIVSISQKYRCRTQRHNCSYHKSNSLQLILQHLFGETLEFVGVLMIGGGQGRSGMEVRL